MSSWTWWKALVGLAIGAVIAGGGWALGQASHHVDYQQTAKSRVLDYISGDQTYYVELSDGKTLFTLGKSDFSPSFDPQIWDSATVSFVFDPEKTTNVDVQSISGTHFKGTAYGVVEMSVYGTTEVDYATSDFRSNPQGYDVNFWMFADFFMGFGGILALLALIFPDRTMILLSWTGLGTVMGPFLGLVFVGITVPGSFSWASLRSALIDDIGLIAICGALGLVIGFLIGIVNAIRNEAP